MSKFLTALVVEKIDDADGGKGTWLLLHPLAYKSDVADTTFVVPVGFLSDFASVPRIPLAFLLTAESAHEAAVLHDFLYARGEVTREMADQVFKEAAIASGEPAWKASLMHLGIRMGGWMAWNDHRRNS